MIIQRLYQGSQLCRR